MIFFISAAASPYPVTLEFMELVPSLKTAPENLFFLQIKKISGAGFWVGAPQWPELKMAGKLNSGISLQENSQ